jgi:hypothetical protein
MIDTGDGEKTYERRELKTPIHWETIIVQGIIQIVLFGGLCISYAMINERWKGAVDADLRNLTAINSNQAIVNNDLRMAISKLSESIQMLSNNQQRVIALLEVHMNADRAQFQRLNKQ